ncbi:MAG TPA: metallophosphoesterase [Allosphingosinicella sp.]
MQVFTIVQIGDVRFPDKANFTLGIDDKDPMFPGAVSSAIGVAPLQAVSRAAGNYIGTKSPDLIAFMGDFTDRGNRDQLKKCMAYLRNLVPTGKPPSMLLFGNHDLDRADDPNSEDRFDPINDIIAAAGFNKASVIEPALEQLTCPTGEKVSVFGLNSCHGCGQTRLLGTLIEKQAGAVIAKIVAGGGTEDELNEVHESIDTPAISEQTLASLSQQIAALDGDELVVVCAHHNLLPQATPRIAPYSELINAGTVREQLLSHNRPIIYLHGHLHTVPVEIIRVPTAPRAAIISISAPLFRKGFNIVELAFSNENVPLGCKITPMTLRGSQVVAEKPITVPAWTAAEGLRHASRAAQKLLDKLERDKRSHRGDLDDPDWPEDEKAAKSKELDDLLRELQWVGVVEIQGEDGPSHRWKVLRSI